MTATFAELGLPASMLVALERINFKTPTPIQAAAIPVAMEGRDVLGSAQTGTGKTAAFGIPMIAKLVAEPQSMAIVMTPTRELAAQVLTTLSPLLAGSQIRTALLIGGDSMAKQLAQLRGRPRIIVGTPGRINDHLEQRTLNLSAANFLVLDETDRMLDMGFGVQIDRILKFMPQQRQTLLFSATIPAEIEQMAKRYQKNPERISVGSTVAPVEKIKQELIHLKEGEKAEMLIQQLYDRKGSVIVFVKTKFGAKRMAEKLSKMDFQADAIHGNLSQSKRDKVIKAFRDKKYRVLIATDVAARGLDIPHIEHVINYDLPQCPEDYIHRVGRTARNGAEGNAVAFITPSDGRLWHAIHKLMNPGDKSKAPPAVEGEKRGGKFGNKKSGGKKFGDRKFGPRKFDGERSMADIKAEAGKYDPLKADEGASEKRFEEKRFDRLEKRARFENRERPQGNNRPARGERFERSDRPERGDRSARPERPARQERQDRFDRPQRRDRFERSDNTENGNRRDFGDFRDTRGGDSRESRGGEERGGYARPKTSRFQRKFGGGSNFSDRSENRGGARKFGGQRKKSVY